MRSFVLSKVLLAVYIFLQVASLNAWFDVKLWIWTVLGVALVVVLLIEAFSLDEVVVHRLRRTRPTNPVV
jgi:hypothetical protein